MIPVLELYFYLLCLTREGAKLCSVFLGPELPVPECSWWLQEH